MGHGGSRGLLSLATLVGQHESRLVLNVQVAAQLKGADPLGPVDEDRDCQKVVADRQLATGEDRPAGQAELVIAALALEDRAAGVLVAGHTAALRAEGLAIGRSPADGAEGLVRFLIGHPRDLCHAERAGLGGK